MGQSEPRPLLPLEEPHYGPAWSPDGTRIAYCRATRIEVVELASGRTSRTTLPCAEGVSWSPDGLSWVYYEEREWPMSRLRVADVASGTPRSISGPGAREPSWSADGRIAYVALTDGQYDVWTCREDGSGLRRVTDDAAREWSPVWSARRGRLYYGSNLGECPDLWSVELDPASGEVLSGPASVTRGFMGHPFTVTAARGRERLALVHEVELSQHWILRLGRDLEPLGPPLRLHVSLPFEASLPQRAPGREEWVAAAGSGGAENLHRFGAAGGAVQLTRGPHHDGAPRWSPDGATIAFHSDRSGTRQIWTVSADGQRLEQITSGIRESGFPVWSPDARRLAYRVSGEGPRVIDLAGRREDVLRAEDGFEPWSWSADGKRLAGTAGGIVIVDVESGSWTRVTDYGERPTWVGDTAQLLFTHEDRLFSWDGRAEPRAIWSTGPAHLSPGLSLGADPLEVCFTAGASKERVGLLDLDLDFKE
jgi:Tol biopolymer transport system component